MTIKKDDIVMMSEELKSLLRENGSIEHIEEFGNCRGVVMGLTDYDIHSGLEVDVRWQPSNLRYAYSIRYLILA